MAERQLATRLGEIRADHLHRYSWAVEYLRGFQVESVIDAACGCGYGSWMLEQSGYMVVGTDISKKAIRFARQHWALATGRYKQGDLGVGVIDLERPQCRYFVDAYVCFETLEHLQDPKPMLGLMKRTADRSLISVPNEAVIPHAEMRNPYHFRHYTREQLFDLVQSMGGKVEAWFGQVGKHDPVVRELDGRTLIVDVRWTDDPAC